MNINVTKTQVSITNDYILNDKEYNVNKCYFTFSEEYTNQLVKKAIFVQGTATIEEPIINNECLIPSEVLNRGTFELRVYAYEVEEEELILRYSPTPTLVYVRAGSYIEGAESPEVITPSQFEQYMQALNDGLNEVANVNIDAEQLTNGSKITITDRTGEEKIVYVYDGVDGVDGKDATINGVNTLSIVAGQNIGLNQVGDTLTINNTYDDTQIVNDITNLQSGLSNEILNRQNADNNLQSQIDAITVSSDVIDVVGTYQELVDYDTSHVKANDIIKVLQDSTHNEALSYYRWVIVNHIGSWEYVGSEGPFYTKSETDELLNAKQNEITSSNKLNADLVDDSTSTNKFITQSQANQIVTNQNNITNLQTNKQDKLTFDETPIENSTNPVTSGGIYTSQEEQNELIDYLSLYANALPKVTGTGTEITLNDTAECPMPMSLRPSATSQVSTTGKNLWDFANNNFSNRNAFSSTRNADGSITFTCTSSGYCFAEKNLSLEAGTYTLSTSNNSNFTILIGGVEKSKTFTINDTSTVVFRCFKSNASTGDKVTVTWIQLEQGSTATDYEPYTGGIPSPNPSYPQDIHTVSGNNTIKVEGKNLLSSDFTQASTNTIATEINNFPAGTYTLSYTIATAPTQTQVKIKQNNQWVQLKSANNVKSLTFTLDNTYDIRFETWRSGGNDLSDYSNFMLEKGEQVTSPYTPYVTPQTLPLNLDTIELCKIGTYEDYFYKDSDKWFLHKEITKYELNGGIIEIDTNSTTTLGGRKVLDSSLGGLNNLESAKSTRTSQISGGNRIQITNGGGFYIRFLKTDIVVDDMNNVAKMNSWLSNNPIICYWVLNTPTNTEITDTTLINQLEVIYNKATSYQDQTNITQVNNDLPFVITASAIYDLSNLLN